MGFRFGLGGFRVVTGSGLGVMGGLVFRFGLFYYLIWLVNKTTRTIFVKSENTRAVFVNF